MNFRRKALAGVLAGTLSLLAAGSASADAITGTTALDNWTFAGAAQVPVPGMTSNSFFNAGNQRFYVTFSAECSVSGTGGWLDVDLVVLNAAGAVVLTLRPTTGSADAFCSPDHTAGHGGWVFASVTGFGGSGASALAAGNYRVQVRARINAGATGGWLGERSLVVWR